MHKFMPFLVLVLIVAVSSQASMKSGINRVHKQQARTIEKLKTSSRFERQAQEESREEQFRREMDEEKQKIHSPEVRYNQQP